MAYATNTGTSSTSGIVRVRGRVATTGVTAAAELIPDPIVNNNLVSVTGLWVSTNSVGNVTLYAVGSDNNIYSYTDTLNTTVAGVAVSNLTTAYSTTSLTPSSATIYWTAVPSPVYTNSAVPAATGPNTSFTYTGTLAYNTSYIWRVLANGTTASTWVNGNFYTAAAAVPLVTIMQTQTPLSSTPTIVITASPAVIVTQAAPVPTSVLTLPEPNLTIHQPVAKTPTYVWIILAVSALLTLAIITLIIRTRRVV